MCESKNLIVNEKNNKIVELKLFIKDFNIKLKMYNK